MATNFPSLHKGAAMRPISASPVIGDILMYVNRKKRTQLPVRITKVFAAVCEVEILAGGLNNSLKGNTIRVHVAMLYKA